MQTATSNLNATPKTRNALAALIMLLAFTVSTPLSHAETYTWDGGASGDWDTSNTNWDTAEESPWNSTNGPSNTAEFDTANTPAVSVAEEVWVNGITFTQSATVSGSTINLAGTTPTVTVNASGVSTIGGILAGENGLNKDGAGLLALSGINTFTGNLSINNRRAEPRTSTHS
jgi:autotransporter-associated beta strand protein